MRRALVLGLAVVVGLGVVAVGQALNGYWETEIVLDLTPGSTWPADVDINSEIGVDYTVGDWTFGSVTGILNGDWDVQDFNVAGVLGAFTIAGLIEFDVPGLTTDWAELTTSVSIAGVSFAGKFIFYSPGDTDFEITASGVAGDVSIDVELYLGWPVDCSFDFSWLEVVVGFPFCCADITAEIYFDCWGFGYSEFCFEGLTIENLPWLTLGACVYFDEVDKVFWFDPEIDLGLIGCDFDLYYRLDTEDGINYDPLNVKGILFDGLEIACEIGGVQFTGLTYWGPDIFGEHENQSPSILMGYEDYWEAYQIATTDDGCCGPFSFDVTVFFDEAPGVPGPVPPIALGGLFDVAYLVANLEIQIATQFTFGMTLETDVQAGTVNDLIFSFLVEW